MDKYEEALKRAKELHDAGNFLTKQQMEIVFPELRESEDETIKKWLIDYFNDYYDRSGDTFCGMQITRILAYLEKQKENPKSADSIPSDCMSDVKCEDRWHKTANSLPDNGRDVLAKDALGNYLIASFDGAQWFVSVYDGEDHPVLHTPPIIEWCDIPSETCKESLHVQETCKENAEYFTSQCGDNRFELIDKAKRDIIAKTNIESSPDEMKVLDSFLFRAWQMSWLGKYDVIVPEQKPAEYEKITINEMVAHYACTEQEGFGKPVNCMIRAYRQGISDTLKRITPAEWSEKDDALLKEIVSFFKDGTVKLQHDLDLYAGFLQNKFKSLRPSWKPSEEQTD